MHGKDVFDRLAILSGTSRGIGAAVADKVELSGAAVIHIGRSATTGSARHVRLDLSADDLELGALEDAIDTAPDRAEWWFFDMAGVLPNMPVTDPGFDGRLREAFRVNAANPLAIGSLLASLAKRRNKPLNVVHLTSGAARRAIPRWGAYCMTKAAAAMGWQVLSQENDNVTVHLVDPGVVDTDMQAGLRAKGDPNAAPETALLSPEQAADAILREARFIL